ncbi:MAG: membrane dipeptidase [Clostridiales bacterium]|nr:membrane dipeptidase [Clostridiales bacterium]
MKLYYKRVGKYMDSKIKKFHEENILVDSHLDLGGIICKYRKTGEEKILNKYFLDDFKKSSFNLIIAAIFVESEFLPDMALKMAIRQIEGIYEDVLECSENFFVVKNNNDLEKIKTTGKIGILISLEGAEPIGMDLSFLNTFYRLGVRGLGLTWSRRNFAADGSYFKNPEEGIRGGLTPFGIKVVLRAEELGIFLDVSHLNDEGFEDVIKYSKKPFIASHSNARSLNNLKRNLTDDQIRQIGKNGGVIGVNGYKTIISENENEQNISKLCDHIEYMINIAGDKNIGFGFDLCNKYYNTGKKYDVIDDHSEVVKITEELLNRGMDEKIIIGILGRNFYEFLKKAL